MRSEGISDSRFEVHGLIGRGGCGAVYQAVDRSTAAMVALKVLTDPDPAAQARFEREARVMHSINHPNVCLAYDHGRLDDGRPFVMMELLRGRSLRELLVERRKLDGEIAIEIAAQLLSGLAEAHARGIIHRDVKPDNVFLVQDRERVIVKLLDFGLCRGTFDGVRTLTREGSVVGTPGYLAPEQVSAAGREVDTRADLFTAGLVLFEMLAGRPVYRGKNVVQLIAGLMTFEVPAIRVVEPSVPPCLERVLMRATERDPDARYQTAAGFLHELLEARTKIRLVRQRASC
ncbi:MAG: serine/threonine-protein kinase [Labilithrix sp.]